MELKGAIEDGAPYVTLRVESIECHALVDTGYDGFVMLSKTEIERRHLRPMGKTLYRTADGHVHEGMVYKGNVEWFGKIQEMAIDSTDGEFVLIGMKLLSSIRMVMEASRHVLVLSSEITETV